MASWHPLTRAASMIVRLPPLPKESLYAYMK